MAKMSKQEEAMNDIATANKVFTDQLQQVLPLWSKPVVSWSSNPSWLATKLSEKFPTLRFSVVYEKGTATVTASPFFKEFPAPVGGQNAESQARDALAASAKVLTFWPLPEVVSAFAEGYGYACDAHKELESLKVKMTQLYDDMRRMPMMPPWFHR